MTWAGVLFIAAIYFVCAFGPSIIYSIRAKFCMTAPAREIMRWYNYIPYTARPVDMKAVLKDLDSGFDYWDVHKHFVTAQGNVSWNISCPHANCDYKDYVRLYNSTRSLYNAHVQQQKRLKYRPVDVSLSVERLNNEIDIVESTTRELT